MGVFGLGAVIGLFVFATYSNTGGDDAVGAVKIWGTLPKEGMNTLLTAAASGNEALRSVTYEERSAVTLSAELASAIATGAAPDLILASQEDLLSLASFIAPLTGEQLPARTFLDVFAEAGEVFAYPGGGFYGVPLLIDPLVLFSNRSILSSAGIAQPPSSWEALTGLVPSTSVFTPARQITRGLIALGTYQNVRNARGILSALFLQTGVPISARTQTGGVTANLGVSGGGFPPGPAVVRFYTQFADPAKVSYTWNAAMPDSRQAFLSGDLALYLGYASEARFLPSANPNLNFDVSALPQPSSATSKRTYGLVYALMIPRGAPNPAGAFQAAAILSSPAEQQIAAITTGLAPASRGALAVLPDDSVGAVAYTSALYTRGWLSPAPVDTDRIFSGMISDVITGRSELETALSSAESALRALLPQ